jgi:predicted  nucleic acid-binding Zn-ribbon protein
VEINTNAANVRTQLENLVRLQDLDMEMLQRRNQIKTLEADIQQAENGVAEQRQALEQHNKEMEKLLKDRREAERTVKERQEQVSKLQGQKFDVKTNEAYNTIESEIKTKKQEIGMLEERVLEMMMSEDELKKIVAGSQVAVKIGEGKIQSDQAKIRENMAGFEVEIQKLQAEWQEAAKVVQAEYLDRYIRLREAKGGMAIARIENDVCMGCRLSIRPQASIELRKYRTLLFCDNCARILYVEA